MRKLRFELPYPPSVNNYWGSTGRIYLKKNGVDFRKEVQIIAGSENPITTKVRVEIEFYPPDLRKRDIDNPLKALLDALEHSGVFDNDNQVEELEVKRKEKIKGGKTIITIFEIRS